jgi:folate-dependent phosphoribosylglycinamide formyltransferase PurN
MHTPDTTSTRLGDLGHPTRMAADGRVVILTAGGQLGWCAANALARTFEGLVVVQEEPEAKSDIIRRRARLLGWPTAVSQAACGIALRMYSGQAKARISEICSQSGLNATPDPSLDVRRVPSVNSECCRNLLRELSPAVVAVYGTRIIKPPTLDCVPAPFINYHAGINPKYRGQHPAYWALADKDAANAGITIHLVDSGVDTGDVLCQRRVAFGPSDTILTYQWAQMAVALPLFAQAIADGLEKRLRASQVDLPSRQHFPPTLGQYIRNGMLRGVW